MSAENIRQIVIDLFCAAGYSSVAGRDDAGKVGAMCHEVLLDPLWVSRRAHHFDGLCRAAVR